jgi:hypothetical protein
MSSSASSNRCRSSARLTLRPRHARVGAKNADSRRRRPRSRVGRASRQLWAFVLLVGPPARPAGVTDGVRTSATVGYVASWYSRISRPSRSRRRTTAMSLAPLQPRSRCCERTRGGFKRSSLGSMLRVSEVEASTPSLLEVGSTPVRSTVQARAAAALLISATTSSGWETIATWLVGTSVVVAFIRLANRRSASGGIA